MPPGLPLTMVTSSRTSQYFFTSRNFNDRLLANEGESRLTAVKPKDASNFHLIEDCLRYG